MRGKIKRISIALLLVIGCLSITLITLENNSSKPENPNDFEIIAHRGVHQDYRGSAKGVRISKSYLNECTASRIYKPTHQYLENTIESIEVAFEYGATIVEIDIRPTKDNQLVVFHDWMLECRTNAQGNVSDHTVEYLKTLDIGYGYTYDGKIYPFRGKGIGKIQTLTEVLKKFPDKKFLIDNKNGNNLAIAQLIVDTLSQFSKKQQRLLYLWCEDKAYEYIHQRIPLITRLILPRNRQKVFFKSYIFKLGFSGISEQYENQGISLPTKYTKFIWGWPNRFLGKVYDANLRFYLYVNSIEEAKEYAGVPLSGVITDRIEDLGKYYRNLKS